MDTTDTHAPDEALPAQSSDFDRLLTLKEVCSILHRSPASIYRDVDRGLLPRPLKIGSSSRWPTSEIAALVDRAKAQRDAEAA